MACAIHARALQGLGARGGGGGDVGGNVVLVIHT